MPRSKTSRTTKGRRRTGCLNCRNRRIKCDEKKPCSYCTRRGLECIQPEFIVRHGWSESAVAATDTNSEPATSYETFRQIYSAEHAGTALPSTEVTTSSEVLTNETAKLLRIYQQGIGTWMDILDHSLTFQRQVLSSALSSPLLFHSICALSAKQMSLTQDNGLWEPISSHHYGESLRLLIHDVTVEGTKRATMLSATILLCSYELLAFPGADYQRHLFGGRTLIEADVNVVSATNLGHASFWIYARQDVSLALVNERPTLIPPIEWPAVPFLNERQEDALGKRILWLLARVIEIRFAILGDVDGDTQEDNLDVIVSEIVHWSESVPSHARGVGVQGDLADGLKQTWFCVPSAAAGCLYYHLAKILCFEFWLQRPAGPVPKDVLSASLRNHALEIASICLSPGISDGALVVAVNPLFYAAKYIGSLPLEARIWGLLEDIERRLGFHTRNRVAKLQSEWVSRREST